MAKKIVIMSDSHGSYDVISSIVKQEWPFDVLVHCGDGINDLFQAEMPDYLPVVRVTGNVDRMRGIDTGTIQIYTINQFNIMVTHGDNYNVKSGYEYLKREGMKSNVQAIVFGHTHRQLYVKGNPVLFNPGAVRDYKYGVLNVSQSLEFEHKYLVS